MTVKTFAAIDVGSFELELGIFEISASAGIREIDHVCAMRWRLAKTRTMTDV